LNIEPPPGGFFYAVEECRSLFNMHFTFFDVIVLITFIVSLFVFFQKPVPVFLKIFPIYYLCAFLTGRYMEWLAFKGEFNSGTGNVWTVLEFCFYFLVLSLVIINVKIRRTLIILIVLFAFFAFINLFFIQKKIGPSALNNSIGSLITVIACIYFFMELFQKKEAQSLARLPAFWIVSGIFFNTILSYPAFAMDSFMETMDKSNHQKYAVIINNLDLLYNIILVLTSILYMIGFLCRIKIRKSTL
jgi:hypothetical protein